MANKFGAFRDRLSQNEIIFKTVAATCLSAMAIIVSIAQFVTARQQVGLSDLQARIAEANALPVFDVAVHQKMNDATGKFDDNYMVVVNGGGPVHDFDAEPMYFLHINAEMRYQNVQMNDILQPRYGSATFDVPVNGYFFTQEVSAASKGTLATMGGYRNNARFLAIQSDFQDIIQKEDSVTVGELIYVRLRYRDLLDRPHDEYYQVPLVGAGSRMSDENGRLILEKWKVVPRVDLSDVKAEHLLAETRNRIESQRGTVPRR